MKTPNIVKKIQKNEELTLEGREIMKLWNELKWYRDALETMKSTSKDQWPSIINKALQREEF